MKSEVTELYPGKEIKFAPNGTEESWQGDRGPCLDSVGNEIHEGAIVRFWHFAGRRRNWFMYKQVLKLSNDQDVPYVEFSHLNKRNESFKVRYDSEVLNECVVVQCCCGCCVNGTLKKNPQLRD